MRVGRFGRDLIAELERQQAVLAAEALAQQHVFVDGTTVCRHRSPPFPGTQSGWWCGAFSAAGESLDRGQP